MNKKSSIYAYQSDIFLFDEKAKLMERELLNMSGMVEKIREMLSSKGSVEKENQAS